jgi:hypothetical protein
MGADRQFATQVSSHGFFIKRTERLQRGLGPLDLVLQGRVRALQRGDLLQLLEVHGLRGGRIPTSLVVGTAKRKKEKKKAWKSERLTQHCKKKKKNFQTEITRKK